MLPCLRTLQIKIFQNVYDAQERYRKKELMQKLFPGDLRAGDIVLLELSVKRYFDKNTAGRFEFGRKREWHNWEVGFTMEAISLLHKGSEHYTPPGPPSEDVDF